MRRFLRKIAIAGWRAFDLVIEYGSGERILDHRCNGGTVILARSLLGATIVFVLAVGVRSRLALGSTWIPDWAAFRVESREILGWYGAIFAAIYVALYTRFASQWSYLAGLYNQIMLAQVQTPPTPENEESYAKWYVGFIDDAETLHLALKPSFVAVVDSLLKKPKVVDQYLAGGPECEKDLDRLRAGVESVLAATNGPRRKVPAGEPAA